MKKNIKIIFALSIFYVLILITGNVNAASATISESKTVTVGTQVTVSASVNAGAWNLTLSGAGETEALVGQTTVVGNASSSTSISFTPSKEGTYVFNLTGDITDFSEETAQTVSKKSTITVVAKSSNDNQQSTNNNSNNVTNEGSSTSNNNQNANNQVSNKKSSVATLNNLGIRPNDFSGFTPSQTSYTASVPNGVECVEIYATKGHSAQTISGTGTKSLVVGENNFEVTVTAEDGTKKKYTLKIVREEVEEEPEEQPEEPSEEISEEAENGEETIGEIGFGLSDLNIEGIDLTPEFKTDVYEYKAKFIGDTTELLIETTATEATANVEVTGNEELQEGENVITILVTDETGEKNATYQIIVTKSLVDEEALAEQEKLEQEEKQKMLILAVAGVVLVVLVSIVFVMIHKKRNRYIDDYTVPYSGLNSDEDNLYSKSEIEENNEEENDEDWIINKKRSKGKRFK